MSTPKTEDQINSEIAALAALKPNVRKRTAFGDDNHAAIDAQIAVLRERMSSDEVYNTYGGNEDSDEYDQHTFDAALSAHDWMTGQLSSDEDAPASSWAVEK